MDLEVYLTFPKGLSLELETEIKKEVKKYIDKRLPKISRTIEGRIRYAIVSTLRESLEYQALTTGQLRGELGIPDTSVVDRIIEAVADNAIITLDSTLGVFGGIRIGILLDDYNDLLTMPEASYFYTSNEGIKVIEWLRWMLSEGTNLIVLDYDFDPSSNGRTGLGVMKKGTGWQIPTEFAGTFNDNFLTRALASIESQIDDIVRQEITNGL